MNEVKDLDAAINTTDFRIVEAVVAAGAQMTPNALNLAIKTRNFNLVEAVIKAGASVNSDDLKLAREIGNDQIINAVKTKLAYIQERKVNSQILAQASRTETGFFGSTAPGVSCQVPKECLIKIASLMGDDLNKIEDDQESYDIAYKNFGRPK